ncbi:hypothetical protein YPA_1497 [Yersinia pestis Antiqua]|uniref:Major facilitator superfamily (MFS) profile domain-containing protein n=1 Tax=Yersinia pestis bv. Antiqua (strain Antiqua) TaxID=360102 RepID=A0A0H2Y5W0_YERPA|nr:hypothetical protein YPA_1497 [Yersinia pestis Antiqua]
MRKTSSLFLLFGTLFSAGGYGATFLISAWFHSQGGNDIDAGATLGMALFGTLIGVPLVGWFAGKLDASRLAALAALIQSCGYFLLGSLSGGSGYLPHVAALLIGLGWGMFYIGGPMALSERLTDTERGPGFTRFSAFQMTGICGSPILLTIAVVQGGIPIQAAFLLVGVMGVFASILLMIFGTREPLIRHENSLRPWVKKITVLAKSGVIRPIVMVCLGGAVFSGMMSFQDSLTDGSLAIASTFFAVHAHYRRGFTPVTCTQTIKLAPYPTRSGTLVLPNDRPCVPVRNTDACEFPDRCRHANRRWLRSVIPRDSNLGGQ